MLTPTTKANETLQCLIICLGIWQQGWETGTLGFLINTHFHHHPPLVVGIIIAAYTFGCLVGCVTVLSVVKHTGIKGCYCSCLLVFGAGSLCQMIWWNVAGCVVGRVLTGVSAGAMGVLVPMFITSTTRRSQHTRYLAMAAVVVAWAVVAGNIMCFLGGPNLTMILGLGTGVTALTAVAMVVVPAPVTTETDTTTSPVVISEKPTAVASAHLASHPGPLAGVAVLPVPMLPSNLLCPRTAAMGRSPLGVACLLFTFQQLTGINYFFYFGLTLFNRVFSLNIGPVLTIIMAMANLAGAVYCNTLIARTGCKNLLKRGSIAMAALLVVYSGVGLCVAMHPIALGTVMMITTLVFVFIFAVTWGPCTGIMICLLSGNDAHVMASACVAMWASNFVLQVITPLMIEWIHFGYGYLFALAMVLSGWYITYLPDPH